ncbi:CHAT domain-containing protein [Parasphingorhabdus pacifica]
MSPGVTEVPAAPEDPAAPENQCGATSHGTRPELAAGPIATAEPDRVVESALWWREHASSAPEEAAAAAADWLANDRQEPHFLALARHVACLAAVELGRTREALRHVRLGLAAARRAELPEREAQLRLTLAWIELERGSASECRAQLAAATSQLSGIEAARAACLFGLAHVRTDDHAEAVPELTEALHLLAGHDDRRWRANALLGRGLAHLYSNRLDEADADLRAAERAFAADGYEHRAAACLHNQGCVAFRAGDLPRALRLFDAAVAAGLDTDACPETLADRAEALAAAGLDGEAREALRVAASRLQASGRTARLAETRLSLAGIVLRDGDALAAADQARQARGLFRSQRRPAWAALASATMWQAKLSSGQHSRYALMMSRRAAATCAVHGWAAAAAELRLTAGQAAHHAGMRGLAEKLLRSASESRKADAATAPVRAVGWLAEALLSRYAGDRDKVFEACRGGLRTIEAHAASITAYELRVRAFGWADQLGEIAVGAALETGDPRLVLRWTERSRANALHRRSLHPPADPELREALVELRGEVLRSRADQRSPEQDAESRITALESRVRHRAMLVDGATGGLRTRSGIAETIDQLGQSVLLSLFTHDEFLYAVSAVDGQVSVSELGRESDAVASADALRHFMTRQAQGGSPRFVAALEKEVGNAATALERQLLSPVSAALRRGRPLVVVPTGQLHALPWAALPSCRGRSVTVTPSLRCWLRGRADAREGGNNEHVWVAGPGLEHAEREVETLHDEYGGRLLSGGDATIERVLRTVDGATSAHIAAHGWFRDDQPLLSCLDLANGPAYGYDLEGLKRGPALVVLSACEVGRSRISRGDQLTGLTSVLLGRGTATVIASVVPVPDKRTARVMLSLHAALRCGLAPAEALASAQDEHGEWGFLCLGYGGR